MRAQNKPRFQTAPIPLPPFSYLTALRTGRAGRAAVRGRDAPKRAAEAVVARMDRVSMVKRRRGEGREVEGGGKKGDVLTVHTLREDGS